MPFKREVLEALAKVVEPEAFTAPADKIKPSDEEDDLTADDETEEDTE